MLELALQFTPTGGAAPRPITVRISDVRQIGASWSAQVDVIGFETNYTTRVHGIDWPQAIELAGRFVALECGSKDGTFEPPIFPRTPRATHDDDEIPEDS